MLGTANKVQQAKATVLKVYLLEPDVSFGHKVFSELRKFGVGVSLFNSARKIFEILQSDRPDVVLLSFNPRHQESQRLAALVEKNKIEVPLIGYAPGMEDAERTRLFNDNGLWDLLIFPFRIHDLLNSINRVVDEATHPPTSIPPASSAATGSSPARVEVRQDVRAPMRIAVKISSDADSRKLWTRNISPNGMFIETAFPFPAGQRLNIEMNLAIISSFLSVEGKVVFIRSPEMCKPGESPGMGIQFLGQTAKQLETLSRVVQAVTSQADTVIGSDPESITRTALICTQSDIFDDLYAAAEKRMRHVKIERCSLAHEALEIVEQSRPDIILCDMDSVPDFPVLIREKQGVLTHLPVLMAAPAIELVVVMELLEKVDDVIEMPSGLPSLVDNLQAFFSLHQRTAPRVYCSYDAQMTVRGIGCQAKVKVISMAGAMAQTGSDYQFPPRSRIDLEIRAPELDAPLVLGGEIVNSSQGTDGNMRYGIKFLHIENLQKNRLTELVEEKLHTMQYLRWTYYPI